MERLGEFRPIMGKSYYVKIYNPIQEQMQIAAQSLTSCILLRKRMHEVSKLEIHRDDALACHRKSRGCSCKCRLRHPTTWMGSSALKGNTSNSERK